MEEQITHIEELFEKTEHYVKSSTELYKLKAIDKLGDLIATLTGHLIVIIVAAFFFIIFNIGVAIWVGEMLGKFSLGFFIVSAFYCVAGILFYFFRKKLNAAIKNSVIMHALKEM